MQTIKLESTTKAEYREPIAGYQLTIAVVAPDLDLSRFSVLMPIVPTRKGLGTMLEAIIDTWEYHTRQKFEQ
jgi:hypothetical protein